VTIYPADGNDDVALMATITGALTQLDMPVGIEVDSRGNIYVANSGSGGHISLDAITVYPPGSNGNVPPAMRLNNGNIVKGAVIKGLLTGLDQPERIPRTWPRLDAVGTSSSGSARAVFDPNSAHIGTLVTPRAIMIRVGYAVKSPNYRITSDCYCFRTQRL
jgi:hypothetical protein